MSISSRSLNRQLLGLALGAVASLVAPAARADGAVTVTQQTRQVIKGFGLFPAPYDRELPTYADGSPAWGDASWLGEGTTRTDVHHAVLELGFDIARTYVSPSIGRPDGSLDPERLQDLEDHLTLLRDGGVADWIVTSWSPPVHMKTPDQVRYGKYQGRVQSLRPDQAEPYAEFLASVLAALVATGLRPPLAISVQNEPDMDVIYDGCVYTGDPSVYRDVVVALRRELDERGLEEVVIHASESAAFLGLEDFLGDASASGFAGLASDPAYATAVGGFAWHTYATAGNIAALTAAMRAYPGRDRWMTEYSGDWGIRGELRPASGNSELDWALNFFRRMGGDLVDLEADYWFFWRGWHSSSAADDQDLTYGNGQKTKAYHAFQKLWTTVEPGWLLRRIEEDEPVLRADNRGLIDGGSGDQWSAPVDLLAFEAPDGSGSAVVLVNSHPEARSVIRLAGLVGETAAIFVSDPTRDVAAEPVRTVGDGVLDGALELPPWSITFVVSEAAGTGGQGGAGGAASSGGAGGVAEPVGGATTSAGEPGTTTGGTVSSAGGTTSSAGGTTSRAGVAGAPGAGAEADAGERGDDDGGCGCRTSSGAPSGSAQLGLALLALLGVGRRRARTRRGEPSCRAIA